MKYLKVYHILYEGMIPSFTVFVKKNTVKQHIHSTQGHENYKLHPCE